MAGYDYFSAQDVADLDSPSYDGHSGIGNAATVSATDPMLTGQGVDGATWTGANQDYTWAETGLKAMMMGMMHRKPQAHAAPASPAGNMGNGQMSNDPFTDINTMAKGTNPLGQLTSFKNLF